MKKYSLFLLAVLIMSLVVLPNVSSAAIADGTYNISYQVNKPGSNSASMANDYFAKPAKLIVKDGKMTMQLTIKKSAWVTEFNPPGGATVISSNEVADQRVVQFPISNANVVTIAMKIDIEDIDYHHSYSVDFVMDSSALPEAKAPEVTAPEVKPTTPEPPKKEETTNSSSGSNTSSNKPATTENTTASSTNEQAKQPATSEKAVTPEAQQTPSDEQKAEEKEVVENPETSDELPIIAIVLFIMAMIVFIRTKNPKTN
ncbi:MAG: heme uptake protein IsdC [Solibacillus sp.]